MNNNVNIKKYNLQDKKNLVLKIEGLGKLEQVEIFKIIKTETNYYTENVNGIFININILSDKLLNDIELFIDYCHQQENELKKNEQIMEQKKLEIYGEENNKIINQENVIILNEDENNEEYKFLQDENLDEKITLKKKRKKNMSTSSKFN